MQDPEPGEVEVLEDNGKQYPPKWIPVDRKGTPENPPEEEEEEKPEKKVHFFKKDMSLLLINVILFCSHLDFLQEELLGRSNNLKVTIMLSFSIFFQLALVLIVILNSSYFPDLSRRIFSCSFLNKPDRQHVNVDTVLNDLTFFTILVLLMLNAAIFVCYITADH
ncbi:uncharacterized protein LOC106664311 [Cimex lectularius]|uniref:Uncharacterized protein n=1 Tax=Cimex lectularius TaxID=79782 RepID=A0A8I6RNJ3_CIMLE|nr:uncharacterized protein LOC106664311 [Cimex lectularius]